MNNAHALDRCHPRAVRIAQVKFVALPMDAGYEAAGPSECSGSRTKTAPTLFTSLRAYLIRVIGRL